MARKRKINEDNQSTTPPATAPKVIEWDDMTPYQQQIVQWGREEPAIEMPDSFRTREQIRAFLKSLRTTG